GDNGAQPYQEPYLLLEPHIVGIKTLAQFVDVNDRIGFCQSLKDHRLLDRTNIVVDVDRAELPLIIEAPSLARFMLLEMWSEFGGDRPNQIGIRNCRHCGRIFHVGGRRHTKSRRGDALYCSDSCKNMASRTRTKSRRIFLATPQP